MSIQIAYSHHQRGDLDKAKEIYLGLLSANPKNYDALKLLGLCLYQMGQVEAALPLLSKAITVNGRDPTVFNIRGAVNRAAGNQLAALKDFEQATQLNPQFCDAHFNCGNTLRGLKRFPEAVSRYLRALAIQPSRLDVRNNLAAIYQEMKHWENSLREYDVIIRTSPDASAFYNLGLLNCELQRFEDAVKNFDLAVGLKSDHAEALSSRGYALAQLGHFDKAIESCNAALSLAPSLAAAHINLGNVLVDLNRLDEALVHHNTAIGLAPESAEAYNHRGSVLQKLGRRQEALTSFGWAIQLRPDYAEAYNNRGSALMEARRFNDALADYDLAIGLQPNFPEAHNNRGNALKELQRKVEALASFDRALSLRPTFADAHLNRGNALKDLQRFSEALESYDTAINLRPELAEAYNNKANTLKELHRFSEALACFDKAIELRPDYDEAKCNKSYLLLGLREFAKGFELYKLRWATGDLKDRNLITGIPAWSGETFDGRLLLWAEQGIGDEILHASLLSLIPDGGPRISLAADMRLHAIYRRSFPAIEILDRSIQKEPIQTGYDAQAAIGDLGAILKLTPSLLECRRYPFLIADPDREAALKAANPFLNNGAVCGLSWKSANTRIGGEKSIALADLAPLLSDSGHSFVSLQYGDTQAEIHEAHDRLGVSVQQISELDIFNDIDGLLALISACDVVVTTSNVTAHLAGAIGKTAVVLLPYGKGRHWYWHETPNSLWYPSLRLLSQPPSLDWSDAIRQAAKLLGSRSL